MVKMATVWTIAGYFVIILIILHQIIKHKNSKRQKLLDALPGPPKWPLLDNLPLFFGIQEYDVFGLLNKLANQFRHMGCFYISLTAFGPKAVYLVTAETVSKVIQNWDHLEKGDGYDMISEYIGDGLVTSKPPKWKHHRDIINPAFTFKMFDDFIRIFNEQSVIMVQLLHDQFDNLQDKDEGFHNLSGFLTRCSLDIILEAAFGTKVEAQTHEISEIHHAMECGIRDVGTRINKPWYRPKWIFWNTPQGWSSVEPVRYSHEFCRNIMRQRIKEREEGTVGYSDGPKTFLDILLDAAKSDKSLTFQDMLDEAITVGAAGHDTVATAINFVLFMLATHPNHQRMVQEELDSIFAKKNGHGYISAADVSQMKYLERCVKETLRLYPAVSAFMRKLQSDIHLDNGIILPKGLEAAIFISVLHQDPKAFPEPEKFDPDRFLPENCVGRHPCAFIPFSAGPRNCIGQKFGLLETKLLVASILREFHVETKDKPEDLKLIPSITVILVNHIRMKLIPRIGN